MDIKRAEELMKIEKECIQRNKDAKCDRECEICDLIQHTDELLEAYGTVIDYIDTYRSVFELEEDKKYLDLIFKMKTDTLCKSNMDDYLIYHKGWLREHLEQEFSIQKEIKNRIENDDSLFLN